MPTLKLNLKPMLTLIFMDLVFMALELLDTLAMLLLLLPGKDQNNYQSILLIIGLDCGNSKNNF